MTYDLRRLRLNALIRPPPHTNRYVLTVGGVRVAFFSAKVCNRLSSSRSLPPTTPGARNPHHAIVHHLPRRRLR
jgi:hypothetical protein